MKNNKKILILILIVVILLSITIFLNKNIKKENNVNTIEVLNNIYTEIDKNDIEYQENITIEDLKKQESITANNEIFEIQEEYDGRKVLAVKASLKYKVAFAGMIKNSIPLTNELDKIVEENLPQYSGIWIENDSRDKVLKLFNGEDTNSKYYIDEKGYLKINQKNKQNEIDEKIETIINSDKQYILDISNICYIIDNITGEILDYNFEKMDKYQTYEYFQDNDRMIIFINENSDNQLTENEIFESLINLM